MGAIIPQGSAVDSNRHCRTRARRDERRAREGTDGKVGNRGVSEGTDGKAHLGAARIQSEQARPRCRQSQSKAHLRAVGSRESPRPRVASHASHTSHTPQIDSVALNRRGMRAP